jgi:hypothetical protein
VLRETTLPSSANLEVQPFVARVGGFTESARKTRPAADSWKLEADRSAVSCQLSAFSFKRSRLATARLDGERRILIGELLAIIMRFEQLTGRYPTVEEVERALVRDPDADWLKQQFIRPFRRSKPRHISSKLTSTCARSGARTSIRQ